MNYRFLTFHLLILKNFFKWADCNRVTFMSVLCFLCLFLFEFRARQGQADRQTDRRRRAMHFGRS